MDYEKLVGKIVADKESRKLGKIIKIEQIEDKKSRRSKPHLLILVKKFLRTDIVIVMDCEKIIKSDDRYVWLDILKENFELEVIETRALMHIYPKD
jgi:hypothetical protein